MKKTLMQSEILFSCLWFQGSRKLLSPSWADRTSCEKTQISWSAAVSVSLVLGLTRLGISWDLGCGTRHVLMKIWASYRGYCIFHRFIFFVIVAFILIIIMQKLAIENRWLEICYITKTTWVIRTARDLFLKNWDLKECDIILYVNHILTTVCMRRFYIPVNKKDLLFHFCFAES